MEAITLHTLQNFGYHCILSPRSDILILEVEMSVRNINDVGMRSSAHNISFQCHVRAPIGVIADIYELKTCSNLAHHSSPHCESYITIFSYSSYLFTHFYCCLLIHLRDIHD